MPGWPDDEFRGTEEQGVPDRLGPRALLEKLNDTIAHVVFGTVAKSMEE